LPKGHVAPTSVIEVAAGRITALGNVAEKVGRANDYMIVLVENLQDSQQVGSLPASQLKDILD
jgi:hypothetical protein